MIDFTAKTIMDLKNTPRSLRHLICTFALFSLANGAFASTDLVKNGSFEQTSLTNSNFFSQVADWTTNSYTFLVFPGTAQTNAGNGLTLYGGITNTMPASSPDRGNFVAADGAYNVGPISQTITGLVPLADYPVTFYRAGAQQKGYNGATTDRFRVTLGSESKLSAVLTNPSHDFQPWEQQSLTFQASTSTEVLSFLAVGTPAGVPPFTLLDGVSLAAAKPEPGYLLILGGWLLCFFAVRMQRRRSSYQSVDR